MKLTKNQKLLVGILHFLPIIGIITYFIYFFSFFIGNIQTLENQPKDAFPIEFFNGFIKIFILLMFTVLISIGIKIFDIIHLTKSNKNDKNNKILMWVLLFLFVGIISEIIYFFLEVLPERKTEIKE